jgi:hypothetical protein
MPEAPALELVAATALLPAIAADAPAAEVSMALVPAAALLP